MYCETCKVTVQSDTGVCPLCHERLDDRQPAGQLYPPRPKMMSKQKFDLFTKIYLFVTLIVAAVTGIVNYIVSSRFTWSVVVLSALVYTYVVIKNTILAKTNIGFKILIQAVLMSLFLYAIDYFLTGNDKWSLEFAIPFLLIGNTLAITVLALSNNSMWRDYILYIIAVVIIGIVPFIFYLTHIIQVYWASLVSFLYSIFTVVGMIIFHKNKLTNELHKSFHI